MPKASRTCAATLRDVSRVGAQYLHARALTADLSERTTLSRVQSQRRLDRKSSKCVQCGEPQKIVHSNSQFLAGGFQSLNF